MDEKTMKRINLESEIHSLERNIKIWEEVSIPKFKASIAYFTDELVKGSVEVALLNAEIAVKKTELMKYGG
jgi:hypothetical protein